MGFSPNSLCPNRSSFPKRLELRGSNGCSHPQDVDPWRKIGFVVVVVVVREHVALVVIVLGQCCFYDQARRIQKASPANPDLANPAHTDQPAPAPGKVGRWVRTVKQESVQKIEQKA